MLPSSCCPHYINYYGFSIKVYATMTSLYFCCHLIVLCHALFLHRPTSVLPSLLLHTPQFFSAPRFFMQVNILSKIFPWKKNESNYKSRYKNVIKYYVLHHYVYNFLCPALMWKNCKLCCLLSNILNTY